MPRPAPRRPRFLSSVPETPEAVPADFSQRDVPRPRKVSFGSAVDESKKAQPPPPDLSEIRREAMERISAAVEVLHLQAECLAEQARADALEIAFQVARKILQTELSSSPEPLFALIRSALQRVGDSRRIVLRLTPEDAALVAADKERLEAGTVAVARIEIVADASLSPGDCMVETDFGKVDGRLATRLEEVRRTVKATLEGDAA